MAVTNTVNNKKPNRRSRKKRRTQDFSSSEESSSSSSSSEAESDAEIELDQPSLNNNDNNRNINIDDIDIDSDNETSNNRRIPENLSIQQKQQLQSVSFTTTPVSNFTTTSITTTKNIPNGNNINNQLDQTKTELNNRYLKLMAMEFENDLDELRKKPDFNENSLVLLAKTLQSGVNMFDPDSLNALLG